MNKEQLLEAFRKWASERGWNIERINNPSGYIEFANGETDVLWCGWQACYDMIMGDASTRKGEGDGAVRDVERQRTYTEPTSPATCQSCGGRGS